MEAGSDHFLRYFNQYNCSHYPEIVAIFEPRISGLKANNAIKAMGYQYSQRIEAQGFKRGIWVLWNNSVKLMQFLSLYNLYTCRLRIIDSELCLLLAFMLTHSLPSVSLVIWWG